MIAHAASRSLLRDGAAWSQIGIMRDSVSRIEVAVRP